MSCYLGAAIVYVGGGMGKEEGFFGGVVNWYSNYGN